MQIVLYQPDIPQNTGSFLRLCACLDLELHIIEPCGFAFDEKKMQRVAMDYAQKVMLFRHNSWKNFLDIKQGYIGARLLLLTTKATLAYTDCAYQYNDFLLLGRESSGVPPEIHQEVDLSVTIPMCNKARSLNVVNAASMVAGEALRQTRWNFS